MKKLKAMLYGAFALVFASISATPGLAGSSDFAGGFISVQASVNGMELEGQHTDQNGAITKGQGGEYVAVGGVEIDVCLQCNGVWLDSDELEQLKELDSEDIEKLSPEKLAELYDANKAVPTSGILSWLFGR